MANPRFNGSSQPNSIPSPAWLNAPPAGPQPSFLTGRPAAAVTVQGSAQPTQGRKADQAGVDAADSAVADVTGVKGLNATQAAQAQAAPVE